MTDDCPRTTPGPLGRAGGLVRFGASLNLEGEHIIKNLVLIGAATVVGATVRGGRLIAEPAAAARYADRAGVAEGQTRPT